MIESYKLGDRTEDLLARVVVMRELQQRGLLDKYLRYGRKHKLREIFAVGDRAINRSVAVLEELEPEIERLLAEFDVKK